MIKYIVINAFSLSEKFLLSPDTILYAEPVRKMMHVYCSKSKKYLGKISIETFENCCLEIPTKIEKENE